MGGAAPSTTSMPLPYTCCLPADVQVAYCADNSSFHRAANSVFGKIGKIASEESVLQLINAKFLPSSCRVTYANPGGPGIGVLNVGSDHVWERGSWCAFVCTGFLRFIRNTDTYSISV